MQCRAAYGEGKYVPSVVKEQVRLEYGTKHEGLAYLLPMKKTFLLLAAVIFTCVVAFYQEAGSNSATPEYTAKGELKLPEQYREWVYLSTGMDMSYTAGGSPDHHMF